MKTWIKIMEIYMTKLREKFFFVILNLSDSFLDSEYFLIKLEFIALGTFRIHVQDGGAEEIMAAKLCAMNSFL